MYSRITAAAWVLAVPLLVTATFIPQHQEILELGEVEFEDLHLLRRINLSENATLSVSEILSVAQVSKKTIKRAALTCFEQESGLDVWQTSPSNVDIHLTSHTEQTALDELLEDTDLTYTDSILPHSLVHPSTNKPLVSTWNLSSLSNSTFHTDYRTVEEIGVFIKDILDLYPDQTRLVPIGHSSQHREMFALEITANNTVTSLRKKAGFVITGAQHAREACVLRSLFLSLDANLKSIELEFVRTVDRHFNRSVHNTRVTRRPVGIIFHGISPPRLCQHF